MENKKKVGILTFHRAHNYGAVLQCYALQKALTRLGHEVFVIDYHCEQIERGYRLFYWRRHISKNPRNMIRCNLLYLNRFRDLRKRVSAFDNFINIKFNLLSYDSRNCLDYCVLGSDQIWNKRLTGGFNSAYWGEVFEESNTKVISYAASMEAQSIGDDDKNFISKKLNKLSAISVREDMLNEILAPLTTNEISTVLDPTLLVDRGVWDNLAKRSKDMPERYILIYMIKDSVQLREYAQKMANEMNAVIVELEADIQEFSKSRLYSAESPEEFLMWFKNALCVLTLSFHGTAFSVIFNRPFFMFDVEGKPNSRVSSLLSQLGLSDRIIPSNHCPEFSNIDYTEANKVLTALQDKSRQYLKSNIK